GTVASTAGSGNRGRAGRAPGPPWAGPGPCVRRTVVARGTSPQLCTSRGAQPTGHRRRGAGARAPTTVALYPVGVYAGRTAEPTKEEHHGDDDTHRQRDDLRPLRERREGGDRLTARRAGRRGRTRRRRGLAGHGDVRRAAGPSGPRGRGRRSRLHARVSRLSRGPTQSRTGRSTGGSTSLRETTQLRSIATAVAATNATPAKSAGSPRWAMALKPSSAKRLPCVTTELTTSVTSAAMRPNPTASR